VAGYVRNDTANNIAPDKAAQAADIDGEFDAIVAAFNSVTGHKHDGTTAEGAPITEVGPDQEFVFTATDVRPDTTNTLDLGTTDLRFKNLYLSGSITVTGNVDGVDVAALKTAYDNSVVDIDAVEASIAAIETLNTTQNTRLTSIETLNTTQNNRLTAIETLNTTQDSRLSAVESVNAAQTISINGINTTLAALTNVILDRAYPVGSLYLSLTATNPASTIGIGTWVAYAAGRAIVGVGTADGVISYAAGTAIGANSVALDVSQMPFHAHTASGLSVGISTHVEGYYFDIYKYSGGFQTIVGASNVSVTEPYGLTSSLAFDAANDNAQRVAWDINHGHTASIAGTVYVWRRTG
jgi:uncharacterized coiled-coil protein SlyX